MIHLNPPSQMQRGAQRVIDTGLPSVSCGSQCRNHISIESYLHRLFGCGFHTSSRTTTLPSCDQMRVVYLSKYTRLSLRQGLPQPLQRLTGIGLNRLCNFFDIQFFGGVCSQWDSL